MKVIRRFLVFSLLFLAATRIFSSNIYASKNDASVKGSKYYSGTM